MKKTRIGEVSRTVVGLFVVVLALAPAAQGANTASWTNTAGGNYSWNVNGNWTPATVPNGQDDVAYLSNNIAGNQTIDLNGAVTAGQLYIGDDNSTHAFVITNTAANTLTFQVASGSAVLQKKGISSPSGPKDTIAANVTLASDISISNAVLSTWLNQPLTISGNIGESGGPRKITFVTVNWEGFVLSGSNSYSGGTALSLGSDAAWLELQNANALGVGLVTSTAGRLSFNMAASGTVPNPIYLNHGNGLYMKNIGSGRVTLSGNLGGAGNIFDNFSGIGTGGGFLLTGSNNVRALVDNTTLWAGTNTAFGGAKVGFGDLGNSGKLYLMNGVTISQKLQDFQFNGSGPKSNLTFTVGTDQANAVASFSGQVELRIGNPPAGINTWNLEAAQGATVTFSGIVSQTSLINTSGDAVLNPVNKIGAGTVVFAANNTYGGPTTVSAGTLRIGNGGTAGTLGTGAVTNNATLAFDRSDTTYTNATPIAGTGTVTKIGTGTVTFSAANVYSGATLVSNGTLRLAATGSISNSSTITVVSGAVFDVSAVAGYAVLSNQTLAGQGVVTGAVRVANGGILAAGGTNAVGVLSFGNNVTLTPGAVLKVDFNATTNDVLNVAGTFAASNQVVVQVSNLDASGPERIMTLVTAAGGITGQDQLSTWTIQGFPLGTYNCRLSVVNNSLRLTVSRRGTAIAIY